MSQKLRGFVGQGMDGRKKAFVSYTHVYPPGSYTWTCPATGYYLLTNWGGGDGGGGSPGASGSFTQSLGLFARGEQVAVVSGTAGAASSFTFRGRAITAGGATGNTPGTASGGDLNLNGSAGGGDAASNGLGAAGGTAGAGATGGAGAPGQGGYRGADGGSGGPGAGASNGAGAGRGFSVIVRQPSSIRT